ncbi:MULTISPECIES: polyribonucleotide nucleotidyltransferase [Actinotignum]|uniref:polyribonucleotide nucleotidyltransferase n=1 Tax=Actinotignum TaxID=1653174 RepID=UPI00254E1BD9|nr:MULTISPECIES: polyribonucleotide nucleotidyltransferase [Actinotignum]MDE1535716.1 polyribonucleotide nucleotidyltransferase [Actinotignum schaalii]MDK7271421.1 polyribonucleotide nucleotidyltransferase [Actinotignum schaalii]MDY5144521.1 polyribonucleotide nucleotidyltransferase [Actinotignum timonense]
MEGPNIHSVEAVVDNGSFGTRTIRFETGLLAQQANGAALAYLDGETTVFSATTASKSPKEHFDFFPLTVDVEERSYAAGKIPGSFFRREGRPGTDAILAARLIDRPLRPLFTKGMRNEVQIVETVLSIHPDDAYDVLAINAASLSTSLTDLPFAGPVGGTRVSLVDGQWIAFPRWSEMARATFSMDIAGRIVGDDVAITMVEAQAPEQTEANVAAGGIAPTEEVITQGLEAAKGVIRTLCEAQLSLINECGKPTADYPFFPNYTDAQFEAVGNVLGDRFNTILGIVDKVERDTALNDLTDQIVSELTVPADAQFNLEEDGPGLAAAVNDHFKEVMRRHVLTENVRMDGRRPTDIRSISAQAGVLPRVHGSAIFQRGETQILGVTTLNMLKMEQPLDNLSPITHKRYIHHYNFPPYCTGETGRVGSPKRREIGHGHLAEMALESQLPSREEFPYAIRQVSETMGSNGSSSMGSVCASTMSLLNAGVPLKAPVAGIAMGLISAQIDGETKYVTLTDILGAEDALGDMDFKVAGTRDYVTALQLDTKLDGIPAEVLSAALSQARDARLAILDLMNQAIDGPDEMAPTAPRILTVKIPVDKIGEVIGPKGKMINQIQEDTGAEITIEDDGTVFIGAADGASAEAARDTVNSIANPQLPEVGERYVGTVVKTTTFGAFISLTPGRDGLLHISQIRRLVGGKRVENVEDVLNVGDKVEVEIGEIDDRGKISLEAVVPEGEANAEAESSDQGDNGDHGEAEESAPRQARARSRSRRRSESSAPSAPSADDSDADSSSSRGSRGSRGSRRRRRTVHTDED